MDQILEDAFSRKHFDSGVGDPVGAGLIVDWCLPHLFNLNYSQKRFSDLQLLQQDHSVSQILLIIDVSFKPGPS